MSELDAYDYELPDELIAQEPLRDRSDSRLMVVRRDRGSIEHAHVRDLPDFLQAGDCLALNDTKVVPARLVGRRTRTGGRWSGLYLAHDEQGLWRVIGHTRGKLEPGETLWLDPVDGAVGFEVALVARLEGGAWAVRPVVSGSAWELLDRVGRVPLPPYIRGGQMRETDRQRYQTVYASRPGAVAAPTAGLHFTPELLQRLATAGIPAVHVTLHVGLGTFRPVSVERLADHVMHSEWGELTATAAERLLATRRAGGRIIAIGTTSVRVLETAAAAGELSAWEGDTRLFIRPPYNFRAVDGLFTNFHLPRSTLLVLVRAFGGDELLRRAYREAILERYRFFSYGDAMLIL